MASFTVDPDAHAAVKRRAALTGESQSDIVERGMGLALAGRVLAFHGPTCPGCGAASGTADSPGLEAGHLRCCSGCGAPDWPASDDSYAIAQAADEAWTEATDALISPPAPVEVEWQRSLETMDAIVAEEESAAALETTDR